MLFIESRNMSFEKFGIRNPLPIRCCQKTQLTSISCIGLDRISKLNRANYLRQQNVYSQSKKIFINDSWNKILMSVHRRPRNGIKFSILGINIHKMFALLLISHMNVMDWWFKSLMHTHDLDLRSRGKKHTHTYYSV